MGIVNGKYVAPTWANETSPAINASELQAISDSIEQLPIANGGTGATTVAGVRNNLGLGNTNGALPIANGGTGATDANTARSNLGITPANIGAVSKSGDTINGDLTVTGALNAGSLTNTVPIDNGGTGATTAASARDSLGVTSAISTVETNLISKLNVINGGVDTIGYINAYNNSSHKVGITWTTQNSQTIPAIVIDGTTYYLTRNIARLNGTESNAGLISSMNLITTGGTWKLGISFTVNGTTTTKYLTLSDS